MQANEVIEAYIDDIVRLLPPKQRGDVAAELRSLLSEELQAKARESRRPVDAALALELVRSYGLPNTVAARYHAPVNIIDPSDSTSFIRAAIIGIGTLAVFAGVSARLPAPQGKSDNPLQIGVLVWLGLLVVWFGGKNWLRRQYPSMAVWKPRDRNRVNRIGAAICIPLAALGVAIYAAPARMISLLTGGWMNTTWAAYTPDFQQGRLPLFIGLLSVLIALLTFAALEGRWRRSTRRISIACNLALASLTLYFAVDGNIFQSSETDHGAREMFALVAMIYLPCVAAQIYGEMGRVEPKVGQVTMPA